MLFVCKVLIKFFIFWRGLNLQNGYVCNKRPLFVWIHKYIVASQIFVKKHFVQNFFLKKKPCEMKCLYKITIFNSSLINIWASLPRWVLIVWSAMLATSVMFDATSLRRNSRNQLKHAVIYLVGEDCGGLIIFILVGYRRWTRRIKGSGRSNWRNGWMMWMWDDRFWECIWTQRWWDF